MTPLHKTLTIVSVLFLMLVGANLLDGMQFYQLPGWAQIGSGLSFGWVIYTLVGGRL